MQVAGEAEPFLVGGELGDGGPRLAQLDGGTHQLPDADHREPDEHDEEQQPAGLLLVRVQPDEVHQRGRRRDRPVRRPDRQGGPAGHREVDEEAEPGAAEGVGEDGGQDGQDRDEADDRTGREGPAHVAEDQRQIDADERGQAEGAGEGGARGVVAAHQVVDR